MTRPNLKDNLGLVRKVVNRFNPSTDNYEDFFQVGCIGLHKAVEKFDPDTGNAFSSFAVPWIRGEIMHYLRDKADPIKLPRDVDAKEKPRISSLNAVLADESSTERIDTLAAPMFSDEDAETVREALELLEYPYKQAITMVYFNGVQRNEAAEWLDVSPMSAARYCDRGIELIQQALANKQSQLRPTFRRSRSLKNQPHDALPYRDGIGLHIPEKLTCPQCDRIFGRWEPVGAKCCSRTCSARLGRQKTAWSPQELNYLKSLIGTMPRREVVATYQRTAHSKKWTHRSATALEVMIARVARSGRATQDNWSLTELAKQLGIDRDRARSWVRFKGLPYRKIAPQLSAIRRSDLQEFCRQRPGLFTGIEFERLLAVLQDEELAKLCTAQPVKVKRRMVQRLDTKHVYQSARAAARALGVAKPTVLREIKRQSGWLKESAVILMGGTQL